MKHPGSGRQGADGVELHPPDALDADGRDILIGRDFEKQELSAAVEDAANGKGRLLLIVGDPGIGKSRLAAHGGALAAHRGMRVLRGRCCEAQGAPPFWPWLQILRAHLQESERKELRSVMGPVASRLAQLLPELHSSVPDLCPAPDPSLHDLEHAEFYLHDAITVFFRSAAGRRPLALILEDLHEADRSSLLLLRFLSREIRDVPILVVGTYRREELGSLPERSEVLRKIGREGLHLHLEGLTEGNVKELIARLYDRIPSQSVVSSLHRITEGNPFFLKEILRLLASRGRVDSPAYLTPGLLEIPQSVREAIRQRLVPLSEDCWKVLAFAAVIGREFDIACLERAVGLTGTAVIECLSEAVSGSAVEALPGDVRRYSFAHALIREVIYDDLTLSDRTRLHHRIGVVLEELYDSKPDEHIAELAHHFLEGARSGEDLDKAARYSACAGEHALSSFAYGEAVTHFGRALHALSRKEPVNQEERCRLLLGLGTAQQRTGLLEASQKTFRQATEIARTEGMPRELAQAALGMGGWGPTPGAADEELVRILEEALEFLQHAGEDFRARLLARLAVELYWHSARERLGKLSGEAVDLARRLGNPATLAYVLVRRHFALLGPERNPERSAIATEILELASRTDAPALALEGRFLLITDLLADGDVQAADPEILLLARKAEEMHQPLYLWWCATLRTTRALMAGRFEEGETLANEALLLGKRVWREPALMYHATHLFLIRREQGRLHELEPVLRAAVEERPGFLPFRCMLLFVHQELGQESEARWELDALARNDFDDFSRDGLWLHCMTLLSEACATLGDIRRSEALYTRLHPFGDRNACAGWGGTCYGSTARALGLLATTIGRCHEAAGHFEDALRMNRGMGARAWVARTEYDYARLLLSSGSPQDHERGRQSLASALDAAKALGMKQLVERASSAMAVPRAINTTPATNCFRREADYWVIRFDGNSLRLRDTKGLAYIAQLLRNPNSEIHVADLAAAEKGAGLGLTSSGGAALLPGARVARPGHAGQLVDARAKADYKQRIEDLRAELEQSQECGDLGRAAKARAEIEFIEQELCAAYGLGGRPRHGDDQGERLRKAVTNRIRESLRRIRAEDHRAGVHLETAIRTGNFCSYSPRQPVEWEV